MATLYRKYRPQNFSDVIGQEHVVLTLQRAISGGRVGHAYLFCGPRGVGKTTVARILAKAVNCLEKKNQPCGKCKNCKAIADGNFVDLIEIDAASNRGIDEMRELRDKIRFAPSVGAKKVYIIDEVHMLTKEAFNALLKTLEEPPAHSIFIFATTEANKVPETVVSRCQRFDFRLADDESLGTNIKKIAKDEGLKISDEIVGAIVKASGGSYRDATSLLDQLSSHLTHNDLSYDEALKLLNLSGLDQTKEFILVLQSTNAVKTLEVIKNLQDRGADFEQVLTGLTREIRHELIAKIMQGSNAEWERMALKRLIEATFQAKNSPIDSLALELAAIDICLGIQPEVKTVDSLAKENLTQIKPHDPDSRKVEIKKEVETQSKPNKKETQRSLNPKDLANLNFDSEKKTAIVEAVAAKNKPLSSLLSLSQWQYDGKELSIAVEYTLHKDKILALSSREILDKAVAEVMGAVVPIKCNLVGRENLEDGISSVFA